MIGLTSTTQRAKRWRSVLALWKGSMRLIQMTSPSNWWQCLCFHCVVNTPFFFLFFAFFFSAIRSSNHSFSRLSAALEAVPPPNCPPRQWRSRWRNGVCFPQPQPISLFNLSNYVTDGLVLCTYKRCAQLGGCKLRLKGVQPKSSRQYIFWGAGDLIFRRAKTSQKTDRHRTKRDRFFWHDENRPPPIVAILRLISSSAGRSIVKLAIIRACRIAFDMPWRLPFLFILQRLPCFENNTFCWYFLSTSSQ